jgi:vacuolar protein sorting-associated protein 3
LIEDQGCDDSHYHTSYALLLAKSALEVVHMEAKYGGKDDKEIDSDVQFIYSLRDVAINFTILRLVRSRRNAQCDCGI